jgi:hypothetical protein
MVKTGARAGNLQALLLRAGLQPAAPPPTPRLGDIAPLGDEIVALYEVLGGARAKPDLRPGGWDLAFEDGLVVELDEELHFNRYRAATLEPAWTESLPWREDYRRSCIEHEGACLAAAVWGKRWTNPSCDRLFGEGGAPGDLSGAGAPRWKQRALYDAMKDAAAAIGAVQLARVATVDVVNGVLLGAALEGKAEATPEHVLELVRNRLVI